jgi:hypothetical protein
MPTRNLAYLLRARCRRSALRRVQPDRRQPALRVLLQPVRHRPVRRSGGFAFEQSEFAEHAEKHGTSYQVVGVLA